MTTTYTLVADQTEKKDVDNVTVNVSTEKTITEVVKKTPLDLKNQIEKLETKKAVVQEEIVKLEAELVEVLKEAEKFELTVAEEEHIEEPIEEEIIK